MVEDAGQAHADRSQAHRPEILCVSAPLRWYHKSEAARHVDHDLRRKVVVGGDSDLPELRRPAFSSALALFGLVVGICFLWTTHRDEPLRAQLVSAFKSNRPSEGRFSGGFQYAPFQLHSQPQVKSLKRIYRQFERELKRAPAPDVQAGFAVLNLAFGKTAEALKLFNQLARTQPDCAEALSDLSAFWLAQANLSQDSFDLVRALDAADRAVHINPDLPEAWFNLAVAQERLFLFRAASRAWARYLSLDEASPWAWEARARLLKDRKPTDRELWPQERLRLIEAVLDEDEDTIEKITLRFPLAVRLWTEEELLPKWGEAELSGARPLADILLKKAWFIANCHEHVTSDSALPDSIEAIFNTRGAALKDVARGHILFGAGRQAYLDERLGEAEGLFRESKNAFAQSRSSSPFIFWAELSISICRFEERDFVESLDQLSFLLREIDPQRYRSLAARTLWIHGMALFAIGEPILSLQSFRKALMSLSGTQSDEDEGAVHYLIAANLNYLGNSQEAWLHLYKALSATPRTIQERRLFTAFDEAGIALEKTGELRSSLYFRDAVISLSRMSDHPDPSGLGHAYLRRAEGRWKVGDQDGAQADRKKARTLAGNIQSNSLREAALARVNIAESETLIKTAPIKALNLLEKALRYYAGVGSYADLPRVYLGRYRALSEMGLLDQAMVELDNGIRTYEQVRERVNDESSRGLYFEQARGLFDTMMLQQQERGHFEVSLWYSERARSTILSRFKSATREGDLLAKICPLEPSDLKTRVPHNVSLVEYALLPDRLLVWVIRRGKIIPFTLTVTGSDLISLVRETRYNLQYKSNSKELEENLGDLYDKLIRPLDSALSDSSSIVFVPDGPLFGLPFAALRDRARNVYLIETKTVSVSPSASFYIEGGAAEESAKPASTSVLVFGASIFDRATFDRLASLSQVEEEARAVGRIYPGSTLRVGWEATKVRFAQEVGHYEIVHFVGHTVAVAGLPSSSMMIFAPSGPRDSGGLHVSELYTFNFTKTRIVVLSSCATGFNPNAGSNLLGFVQPFLSRRVNAVLASLWDVSDHWTSDLAVEFHRQLQKNRVPALALRKAQVEQIHSKNSYLSSPSSWAVLQLFATASNAAYN